MKYTARFAILVFCFASHVYCSDTNVFITNNSPHTLFFNVLCFSALVEEKQYYKAMNSKIDPWEHGNILQIKRSLLLKALKNAKKKETKFKIEGFAKNKKEEIRRFYLYISILLSNKLKYWVSNENYIDQLSIPEKNFKIEDLGGIKRAENLFKLDGKKMDILYRDIPKKSLFHDIEYALTFQPGKLPKVDERSNVLHLYQHNLWMRPKVCCAFAYDGQRERAQIFFKEMFASGLEYKPDIIALCEAFDTKSLSILKSEAKKNGYKYSTLVLAAYSSNLCSIFCSAIQWLFSKKDKWPTLSNGGVIIFSRFPIKVIKEKTFGKEHSSKSDSIANKGCLYIKINKNGKPYHIFATHTDANLKDVRLEQYKIIEAFINDQKISKNEPVIILGDMNVCSFSEGYKDERDQMLKTFNANIIKNIGFKYSLARKGKPGTRPKEQYYNALVSVDNPDWGSFDLDLLLTKNNFLQPKKAYRNILAGRLKFAPWVDQSNHTYFGAPSWELSDHQGVDSYLEF